MQAKLTTEDLPLIIAVIIGSIIFILLIAKSFGSGARKCESKNITILKMPFIIMYALPLLTLGAYKAILSAEIPSFFKVFYIIASILVVIIPTVFNVVKLGLSGISISFFQAICGITIGAIALASLMIAFIVIAIGCIGGLGGSGNGGRKVLRSVDDGTVVYVSDWGDCWKDKYGNCYYTYSGGNRWYDDYGRDYVE